MKKFLLLSLLFCSTLSFAQTNVDLVGHLPYNDGLSDIWGWEAPDGTEYALVGLHNAVSIVSLADPANPVEVANIPGQSTIWRDLKTWNNHAYVIADATTDGLLVINLENLPDNFTDDDWYYYKPEIPGLGTYQFSHNLYIDEFGIIYLAGANLNGGGLIYLDADADSWEPPFVGLGSSVYSHDVYVRDNIAYSSEINVGQLGIYDVSDKENTILLATQTTPIEFTHNAWLSDDGNYIFTTEEQPDGPTTAYDISDLDNIQELDQYRPPATLGSGVIPHNTHVIGDFLVTSHYADGCIIVDASNPSNLVEVGNYDTSPLTGSGFIGAWGAYPFLPSGLILISDIEEGLFVLDPTYVSAAYLEGIVVDAETGEEIQDATISFQGISLEEVSNINGEFKTGTALAGDYTLDISKSGYFPTTEQVTLVNGEITELIVELQPKPSFAITGQVVDAETGAPINNAKVRILNDEFAFNVAADSEGNFSINTFFEGNYTVAAGKWLYKTTVLTGEDFSENDNSITIELEEGIEDIFSLDLGWIISTSAQTGEWEFGTPIGVTAPDPVNFLISPDADIAEDPMNSCFVTGNTNDLFSGVLLGGNTTLASQTFDLSSYNEPYFSFYAWLFTINQFDFSGGIGTIEVILSNGSEQVTVTEITQDVPLPPSWEYYEFSIKDFIEVSDNMRVLFRGIGGAGYANVSEMALDYFQVWDANATSTEQLVEASANLFDVYPNPTHHKFILDLKPDHQADQLQIFNMLGQQIETIQLIAGENRVAFGENLDNGVYFVQLKGDNFETESMKVIKQ